MQQSLILGPFMPSIAFSAKKQAYGPEAMALRGKSIGPVISDCGLLVAGFSLLVPSLSIFIPLTSNKELIFQSAFRNRHFAIWRRPNFLTFRGKGVILDQGWLSVC